MRSKLVALSMLAALSAFGLSLANAPAKADQFLWCAVYNANGQGNCFYKTLEQCRTAIAGGGACSPNLAYDRRDAELGRRHHTMRY
jgi:uncharacterized protein DUF3551